MTDRELVATIKQTGDRKLTEQLWRKYDNLVHKNWAVLRRQLDNSAMIMRSKDDFYSECYIAFTKALEAIDMDKITNDKWLFLGYFRLYLKNVRSDFIRHILREHEMETSFYIESKEDGELIPRLDLVPSVNTAEGLRWDPVEIVATKAAQENCDKAVAACMSSWDPARQKIYRLRKKGIAKSDIAKRMNVHPATITYYLKSMKKDLQARLF